VFSLISLIPMTELPKAYVNTLKHIQVIHNCIDNKKVPDEV